eukprot:s810_g15.t1
MFQLSAEWEIICYTLVCRIFLTKSESLSQTSIGAVGDGDQTRWLVLMAEQICPAEWYRKHISANAKAGLHAKLQQE